MNILSAWVLGVVITGSLKVKKEENVLLGFLQLEGGKRRETDYVSMEERYSTAGFKDLRKPQTKE